MLRAMEIDQIATIRRGQCEMYTGNIYCTAREKTKISLRKMRLRWSLSHNRTENYNFCFNTAQHSKIRKETNPNQRNGTVRRISMVYGGKSVRCGDWGGINVPESTNRKFIYLRMQTVRNTTWRCSFTRIVADNIYGIQHTKDKNKKKKHKFINLINTYLTHFSNWTMCCARDAIAVSRTNSVSRIRMARDSWGFQFCFCFNWNGN